MGFIRGELDLVSTTDPGKTLPPRNVNPVTDLRLDKALVGAVIYC